MMIAPRDPACETHAGSLSFCTVSNESTQPKEDLQVSEKPPLTAKQAASFLDASLCTVYKWLKQGELAGKKIGGRWFVYQPLLAHPAREASKASDSRPPILEMPGGSIPSKSC